MFVPPIFSSVMKRVREIKKYFRFDDKDLRAAKSADGEKLAAIKEIFEAVVVRF